MSRLDEDMEVDEVPPNPNHGEPGHDCPMEHWFELRLQGVDIARIVSGLNNVQDAMKAAIIGAILEGRTPPDQLERVIAAGEALEELTIRLEKPLEEEYATLRNEWARFKEWHL